MEESLPINKPCKQLCLLPFKYYFQNELEFYIGFYHFISGEVDTTHDCCIVIKQQCLGTHVLKDFSTNLREIIYKTVYANSLYRDIIY